MSDVRALLKAKRQEARISHPYASYNASGQLKCTVCGTAVKHASAWEGHLGSKAHRTNIIRIREQEKQQRAEVVVENDDVEMVVESKGKRKSPDEPFEAASEKKRKLDTQNAPKGFPNDFFSDPSHAPVLLSDEDDEEEEMVAEAQPSSSSAPQTSVDLEYERFQRELMSTAETDPTEAYQRATVAAEPVVASTQIEGFPPNAEDEVEEPAQLTEEEIRQRKEQEERELIMDRLLEEERAQEDADTRVLLLKNKVEALRRKREAMKAQKATASS